MARTDYGAILSTVIKDTSDAIREVNGTSALIAPANWGTNIRTMKSADDYDNVLDQLIQEEVASAPVASFSDGANDIPLKELSLAINPTQSGSGDPAPDNVRPITGVSSVNVTRTGKNIAKTNSWTGKSGSFATMFDIPIPPNTPIAISGVFNRTPDDTSKCALIFNFAEGGNNWVEMTVNSGSRISTTRTFTKTVTSLTYYSNQGGWAASQNYTLTVTDFMVELGSTASDYSPYQGNTYTIDLDGTRYGGTIDIVDGEAVMTVTSVITDMLTYKNSITKYTTNRYQFLVDDKRLAPATTVVDDIFCDKLKTVSRANIASDYRISAGDARTRAILVQIPLIDDTIQGMKDWIDSNNPNIVYPLATPFTVNLGSVSIPSLLGQNNIWHDGNGDTSCTYYANGQLYVEQHSQETRSLPSLSKSPVDEVEEESDEGEEESK